MDRDLDPVEVRVLGCLIEKQRTTPDQYPLSLNALRNACNQTTNRNPIVAYDEEMLRGALQKLGRRRYSRLTTGHTSRAAKYRHLLDEALPLDAAEQAIMAVLFLRGEQTPGELKQRTERMQPFDGIEGLQDCLTGLIDKGFVSELARRPGQKEERFKQNMSDDLDPADVPAGAEMPAVAAAVVPPPPRRDERLDKLEGDVLALRTELSALRDEFAALRAELGA
ncbi:YceH family protein [Solirubrobacter taibaiensis]|nr:YceH family protein [Solirubrobacter taibaiensis]